MFSCCGGVSTHARKVEDLNTLRFNDKELLLKHCIHKIVEIKDPKFIYDYFTFLCSCISGCVTSFDMCSKDGIYRHIYVLTGNASNNLFARQIITKSAALLIFFLCVKPSQFVEVNSYNNSLIIFSDCGATIDYKCKFINKIL